MKCTVKIFFYLLAPAQISVPVDVKSEAATGKMLCLVQDKGAISLLFQLMRRSIQKKYNYSYWLTEKLELSKLQTHYSVMFLLRIFICSICKRCTICSSFTKIFVNLYTCILPFWQQSLAIILSSFQNIQKSYFFQVSIYFYQGSTGGCFE